MATPARLTRKQQQERTRACLLDAARRVFARDGLHQASVELVATEAGFTKGAFYANFPSKEAIFLELLDQHFTERAGALQELLAQAAAPRDQARAGAAEVLAHFKAHPEWERLFFEFTAQAGRDAAFRAALSERWSRFIAEIAEGLERYLEQTGLTVPGPVERYALMLVTITNGVALQHQLNPARVDDELLPDMFELLTVGVFGRG